MKYTRLWIILLLGTACSTTQKLPKDMPIIDAHMHVDLDEGPQTQNSKEKIQAFQKELKNAGAVGAIVHSKRDDFMHLADLGPNVLYCAGLSKNPPIERLRTALKAKKVHCIKIYLGYQHQFADHPIYRKVYDLAREFKVPVVFHTGDTYSTKAKLKYADPLTIDDVAVDYPDVKFVLAHAGNPWIQSAAEVAYKNPNVYLDVSAFMVGELDKYPASTIRTYVTKPIRWIFGYVDNPKKILFGSDSPLVSIAKYRDAVAAAIPQESQRAVFFENAMEVFPFPKTLQSGTKK